MKKTVIIAAAAVIIAGTTNVLTASAEEMQKVERHDGTTYTYDECVSIIFGKAWGNTYDDGVTFPQQSFLYHRIRDFLDESYMSEENDHYRGSWDRYGDIANKWTLYNKDYWSEISSNDDDNGNYTIIDKNGDLLYTFELVDGVWQQLDTSGNVVDTFEPHPVGERPKGDIEYYDDEHNLHITHEDGSTEVIAEEDIDDYYERKAAEEEEAYDDENEDTENGDSMAAVTGMVDDKLGKPAEPKDSKSGSAGSRVHSDLSSNAGTAGTAGTAGDEKEKDSKGKSKALNVAIGSIAGVAAVGALVVVKKKRK